MRLTRITLLLITLVMGLGFYQLTTYLLDDVEPQILQATEEVMVDAAHVFSELVSQEMNEGALDKERLREMFQYAREHEFQARIFNLEKQQVGLNLYVTDAAGVVIFDSDQGKREGQDYRDKRDVRLTLAGEYGARSTREAEEDSTTSIMYVAAPLGPRNRPLGVVTVFKKQADALPMIAERRAVILRAIVIIGIGILLLIAAVFWWVYQPIGVLTDYAKAVEKGQRPPRPKLGAGREVNTLYHALETMREALEGRRYVEHFTQTLTHEMKSPLAAIRGAAELLEEEMPEAQRQRFLANIRSESQRAERLISRLLELAVVESRSHLEAIENLDLIALVDSAMEEERPAAENAKVRFGLNTPDFPVRIMGDPIILRAAISNLLENALEFSPAGATVEVAIEVMDDQVFLHIDDQGPGVPEYAKEKIFEKFYSLRHHHTGRKGTGLGLNLVREATDLHRGSITLVNRVVGGARATICLPRS
ncbi:MAG: two-component system sensor histidine kinase CreC [Verrucomicrobiota bacterium]|jgi:two-component system sensor histidine kinase CreC